MNDATTTSAVSETRNNNEDEHVRRAEVRIFGYAIFIGLLSGMLGFAIGMRRGVLDLGVVLLGGLVIALMCAYGTSIRSLMGLPNGMTKHTIVMIVVLCALWLVVLLGALGIIPLTQR
jgi:hypothetical protein